MAKARFAGFSIKYKLVFLLTLLPVFTLVLYLALAVNLFESDKIAYVFDSTAAVSKTLAAESQAEINSIVSILKPIIEGYDFNSDSFDKTGGVLFEKETNLKWLAVYRQILPGGVMKSAEFKRDGFGEKLPISVESFDSACANRLTIQPIAENAESANGLLQIALCQHVKDSLRLVVAQVQAQSFYQAFEKGSIYSSYLVDQAGHTILGPELDGDFSGWSLFSLMKNEKLPTATQETIAPGGRRLIAAFSRVAASKLLVISFVDREVALRAVQTLFWKSVLFLIALLALGVIISVFASNKLTSTLRELEGATHRVAEGKFDIQVNVRSRDEVGHLAQNFNRMASEVSRLMAEHIVKTRMEKELEMAKHVQETLFPPNHYYSDSVQVAGFYHPASECGGDWWYYSEIGKKVFLWIGDVTGHGAPAALITSAAKATATIIEGLPSITPARALDVLNKVIYNTANGSMQMTFFLASLDRETGEFVYSNASHNPPFLIGSKTGPLSRQDFVPVDGVNNARLGERRDSKYAETRLILKPGDSVLFYTDGVIDLNNPAGKVWGERNFIKSAISAYSSSDSVDNFVENIRLKSEAFRNSAELHDDVTLFVCRMGGLPG